MEQREVLTFEIAITHSQRVTGHTGEAEMILFAGTADCPNFKGVVLLGGVDTQMQQCGAPRTLSARYMLRGTDASGAACSIFVENNGTAEDDGGEMITTPRIITDSKMLAYLETAELTGTITPREQGVTIHIFAAADAAEGGSGV